MFRNYLLDLFRAILTIFVLLYHLGLCEAGFLAVCGFFTISGYLLASTINNSNFNLKDYYLKRLKSIYLPLIVVTLSTVFVFRYVVDIPWVTIKQETLSVIFGYNNFFQIGANNNYFIRSDASPFTHMWYICILIQLEAIVPLIVSRIKSFKTNLNKKYLYIITLISILCFVLIDYKYGMAISYYSTISRLFSFLIGYSAYHITYINFDKKPAIVTLVVIVLLFLVGDLSQKYYASLMILVSILSGAYIVLSSDVDFKNYKIVNTICRLSYIIYLIQYPIIYIVDNSLDVTVETKVIIELLLIIVLSIIYTIALNKNDYKYKKVLLVIVVVTSSIGGYEFITCPDYYKEMEELKIQLEINQDVLANRQAEYLEKIKDQQTSVINDVAQIDEALNNMDETTKNAQVLLIGDSIMLGGSFHLDEYFNNYYCDAKGSRNGYLAYETLKDLLDKGVGGEYIVIHLGTNSGLELEEVESIASLLDDQKVIWLTITNGWRSSQNPMLEEYCETHDNHYLADWYNFSLGHKEYFIADGLHLSDDGRYVYDQFIFDNLKEVIKEDLLNKKQELINKYNSVNNDTISFYGNDLLINLFEHLNDDYLLFANSNYDFDSLYKQLSKNKDELCLSKTIFILLDKSVIISEEQLDRLFELLADNELYIFAYNNKVNDLSLLLDNDCFLQDGVHLNEEGNRRLLEEIERVLN